MAAPNNGGGVGGQYPSNFFPQPNLASTAENPYHVMSRNLEEAFSLTVSPERLRDAGDHVFETLAEDIAGNITAMQDLIVQNILKVDPWITASFSVTQTQNPGRRTQRFHVYPDSVPDPTTSLIPPRNGRHFEFNIQSVFEMYNTGFTYELGDLMFPGGIERHIGPQMRRLLNIHIIGQVLIVHNAIKKSISQLDLMLRPTSASVQTHNELFAKFFTIFGIFNRDPRQALNVIKKTALLAGGPTQEPVTTLVLSKKAMDLVTKDPYFTEYWKSGPGALGRLEQGSEWLRTWDGVRLSTAQTFALIDTATDLYDPMLSHAEGGAHAFVRQNTEALPRGEYDSENMGGVRVCSWNSPSNMHTIKASELIRANQYYDPRGQLRVNELKELARHAATTMQDRGVDTHYDPVTGVPVYDPFLYQASTVAGATEAQEVATYVGDVSFLSLTQDGLEYDARVLKQIVENRVKKQSSSALYDFQAGLEQLERNADQSLAASPNSPIEAMARAVYRQNIPTRERDVVRSNAFGASSLPLLQDGTVEAASGVGRVSIPTTSIPGASTAAYALYLGSLADGASTPNEASWRANPAFLAIFQTMKKFISAARLIFTTLNAIMNPSQTEPNLMFSDDTLSWNNRSETASADTHRFLSWLQNTVFPVRMPLAVRTDRDAVAGGGEAEPVFAPNSYPAIAHWLFGRTGSVADNTNALLQVLDYSGLSADVKAIFVAGGDRLQNLGTQLNLVSGALARARVELESQYGNESVTSILGSPGAARAQIAYVYAKLLENAMRVDNLSDVALVAEAKNLLSSAAKADSKIPTEFGESPVLRERMNAQLASVQTGGRVDDYIATRLSISRQAWRDLVDEGARENLYVQPVRATDTAAELVFDPAGRRNFSSAEVADIRSYGRGGSSSGEQYGPPQFHYPAHLLAPRTNDASHTQAAGSSRARGGHRDGVGYGASRLSYPPGTTSFAQGILGAADPHGDFSDHYMTQGVAGHCANSPNFTIRVQQIGQWYDTMQRMVAMCRLGSNVRTNETWFSCVRNNAPALLEFLVVWPRILLEVYYTYALNNNAGTYEYAFPHITNAIDPATRKGQVGAYWCANAMATPFGARVIPGAVVGKVVAGRTFKIVPSGGLQSVYDGSVRDERPKYDILTDDFRANNGYSALVFSTGFAGSSLPSLLPLVGNSPLTMLNVAHSEAVLDITTRMWVGSLFFDAMTGVAQLNATTAARVRDSADLVWGSLLGDFDREVPRAGMLSCHMAIQRYDAARKEWVDTHSGSDLFQDEKRVWGNISASVC